MLVNSVLKKLLVPTVHSMNNIVLNTVGSLANACCY